MTPQTQTSDDFEWGEPLTERHLAVTKLLSLMTEGTRAGVFTWEPLTVEIHFWGNHSERAPFPGCAMYHSSHIGGGYYVVVAAYAWNPIARVVIDQNGGGTARYEIPKDTPQFAELVKLLEETCVPRAPEDPWYLEQAIEYATASMAERVRHEASLTLPPGTS